MQLQQGQVAVVTGAASGIGLALAERFGAAGLSVVLADVDKAALDAAAEQVAASGVDTLSIVTDVADADAVTALADATYDRFGAAHVICNNAGVSSPGDPWFGPMSTWTWVFGVNFWGVVHGVRAFLPRLIQQGGGHVVNTASTAGLMPGFGPVYDATKHAVVAMTEDLYRMTRVAQLPIGVSCVCPGWIRTQILDADRNWPEDLGERPAAPPGSEVMREYVRQAIDNAPPPSLVADTVVDAVQNDRFWVFPNPEFVEMAANRWRRIADHLDPEVLLRAPGIPDQE
ncbi:MAG TPA: SDR family NAD(P)-dependent oxidoreductase [Mycobacteriales bacterium]|nr:SDR family NAD(P)-dependent oxidoreductase [Mycobacteriales bacterium]